MAVAVAPAAGEVVLDVFAVLILSPYVLALGPIFAAHQARGFADYFSIGQILFQPLAKGNLHQPIWIIGQGALEPEPEGFVVDGGRGDVRVFVVGVFSQCGIFRQHLIDLGNPIGAAIKMLELGHFSKPFGQMADQGARDVEILQGFALAEFGWQASQWVAGEV